VLCEKNYLDLIVYFGPLLLSWPMVPNRVVKVSHCYKIISNYRADCWHLHETFHREKFSSFTRYVGGVGNFFSIAIFLVFSFYSLRGHRFSLGFSSPSLFEEIIFWWVPKMVSFVRKLLLFITTFPPKLHSWSGGCWCIWFIHTFHFSAFMHMQQVKLTYFSWLVFPFFSERFMECTICVDVSITSVNPS